ncbi:MAG: uncharacterized protein JWM67_1917 [Mycobacterium sp.]|nr:uncharacterized protein [Mycobacterium sp.]
MSAGLLTTAAPTAPRAARTRGLVAVPPWPEPVLVPVPDPEPPLDGAPPEQGDSPAGRHLAAVPLLPVPPAQPAAHAAAPPAVPPAPRSQDGLVAVVRTPRTALPDPRRVAPTAVRGLLEVVAGERPARHLRGLLTPRVALQLDRIRRPGRCSTGTVRSIRVSEPTPGVAEVCAVVRRGERYAFLAARLQGLDGRWQVTHLQLGF